MKINTIFTCTNCGAQYAKWQGRCLDCGKWGTLVEETAEIKKEERNVSADKPINLATLVEARESRLISGIDEFDRVLGGGLVVGSFILLGGDPGVGKSTLALEICKKIKNVLYVSGEESAIQIKIRAERLALDMDELKFLPQTNIEKIIATGKELRPQLLIIDSIQTISTADSPAAPGSVAQITACAAKLLEFCKQNNISTIIIGHVTKDGFVAGPKTLEHLVDVVLYLENDNQNYLKILRGVKNRFGSIGEIGVFEMAAAGLKEIKDPAQIFLESDNKNSAGAVTAIIMEGSRPFFVEVQSLCNKTFFGYPQRKASGYDLNRLQMLAAVLAKHGKINLANQDIYLNIAGGLKIKETGADLAVCLAIISALNEKPLPNKCLAIGEVGLSGEVRSVPQLERRIKEARKMDYGNIFIPATKNPPAGGNIKAIKNISEAAGLIK